MLLNDAPLHYEPQNVVIYHTDQLGTLPILIEALGVGNFMSGLLKYVNYRGGSKAPNVDIVAR